MISYGLLHEEFGKVCSNARTLLTVHDMVAETVLRLGGALRGTCLAKVTTGTCLAAFALTEPEAGSDAASIATTAVETEDGYVLNGRKKWISFGQLADLFLVVARAGKGGPPIGFLVKRDTPGLTVAPITGMLGLRGSMLAELSLDDCEIPGDCRVGSVKMPDGLVTSTALHLGRYSVAWGSLAIAEACVRESFRYAGERVQFGGPIGEHQLIRRMLTDMLADVRAARLLCYQAGYLRETGDPGAVQATLVAKYFASRMANRVASDAVQIHGALGVSGQKPVERHFRDARIMEIIEGSTEIQQLTIAKYGIEHYGREPARTETTSTLVPGPSSRR
jgi:alkylation response protein AidB-like acyl-CoA dehydrogenase